MSPVFRFLDRSVSKGTYGELARMPIELDRRWQALQALQDLHLRSRRHAAATGMCLFLLALACYVHLQAKERVSPTAGSTGLLRAFSANRAGTYSLAHKDVWCKDPSGPLFDNRGGADGVDLLPRCEAKCDADHECRFMLFGFSPIDGYYRCSTFRTCDRHMPYEDGHFTAVYQKAGEARASAGKDGLGFVVEAADALVAMVKSGLKKRSIERWPDSVTYCMADAGGVGGTGVRGTSGSQAPDGNVVYGRAGDSGSGWLAVEATTGEISGLQRCCPGARQPVLLTGRNQLLVNAEGYANSSSPVPGVSYIYVPEDAHDVNRSHQMDWEFGAYVPAEWRGSFRRVAGIDPELWPEGGRYEEVKRFGMQLPSSSQPTVLSQGAPDWWSDRNLRYAEVDELGHSTFVRLGLGHHCGASLSHFVTWMDARHRDLEVVLVAESDGFPSRIEREMVGSVCDFADLVRGLIEEAPADWHLIQLDKGRRGVKPDARPSGRLSRPHWSAAYDVYRWTGERVAGAALYLASRRFLEQVPTMIHDHGFDMVDAYLGFQCSEAGTLKCYSVEAVSDPSARSHAGIQW